MKYKKSRGLSKRLGGVTLSRLSMMLCTSAASIIAQEKPKLDPSLHKGSSAATLRTNHTEPSPSDPNAQDTILRNFLTDIPLNTEWCAEMTAKLRTVANTTHNSFSQHDVQRSIALNTSTEIFAQELKAVIEIEANRRCLYIMKAITPEVLAQIRLARVAKQRGDMLRSHLDGAFNKVEAMRMTALEYSERQAIKNRADAETLNNTLRSIAEESRMLLEGVQPIEGDKAIENYDNI